MKQRVLARISELGLGELFDDLLQPGTPLAFLGAQLLFVAGPVMSAFTDGDKLEALAVRLEGFTPEPEIGTDDEGAAG